MIALGSMLIVLLGVAGLMVLALADFNAVVQIMVYVGGILILLLFGYMISNRYATGQIPLAGFNRLAGSIAAMSLFLCLAYAIFYTPFNKLPQYFQAEVALQAPSTLNGIGISLFTQYFIPFEIGGIVLLLAFVYAATMAKTPKP
jgi:NADH-quinone oxidoreductase subunit J